MNLNHLLSILTAAALGLALGFFLQRGRFCLNSAFRDIIFLKNLSGFRAYLLAAVVAMAGANLLQDLGLMITTNPLNGEFTPALLPRQNFLPLANILGGILFGMGMVLVGGCASGILYRLGEGQTGAIIAIIGFFFGAAMTIDGMLSPLYRFLGGFSLEIGGVSNPAFWQLFGQGMRAKWGAIGIATLVVLAFVFKGKPQFGLNSNKTYTWGLTGVLIGLLVVAGWWVSSRFGGFPRGLVVTEPIRELFGSLLFSRDYSPYQQLSLFGVFQGSWGMFFIFSVPLGACLSARGRREFSWKIPTARQFLTIFGGSVLMGVGAAAAGGCNIGHGLTGVSTGALSSIVATAAILTGNWVMTYFRFIRPAG